MQFHHPFRCLEYVPASGFIVASAGASVFTFDANSGNQLSAWSKPEQTVVKQLEKQEVEIDTAKTAEAGDGERPGKKRKIAPSEQDVEAVGDGDGKEKMSANAVASPSSTIPIVTVSDDGRYVVAVTSEDKCVRVFEIGQNGTLAQLSDRCMPKRPCAAAITSDNSTILIGDKFGDVYSLPLLPGEDDLKKPTKAPKEWKPMQPAATNLTVHTKGNLFALQQQLRTMHKAPEKMIPNFKLTLLLGHVSMLTDIAIVTVPGDTSSESGKARSYILTSDRDEHIRVSRGIPHAHIIENYCLGHSSFVSKMCIPQWRPELMVSGGGDDFLLVWDWRKGAVLQKLALEDKPAGTPNGSETDTRSRTVRNIWAVPLEGGGNGAEGAVFVALEGTPKLLSYVVHSNCELRQGRTIPVSGNVIDLTNLNDNGTIVISVDCVHENGSTREWRKTDAPKTVLLEALKISLSPEGLASESIESPAVSAINQQGTSVLAISSDEKAKAREEKLFSEALYSLDNLKKMGKTED